MNREITVYTSIVGSRDRLREDQVKGGAEFVAFVDRPWPSAVWTALPAYAQFRSSRRNARAPKILAHHFIHTPFSVWIDGSVAIRVSAAQVIDEFLGDYDLAVFRHPKRSCLFDEARECSVRGLDDPALLREQAKRYSRAGFGSGRGLAETTVILRRHNRNVENFNHHWWAELCRNSVRDQVSFMYSAFQTGLKLNLLCADVRNHPYFSAIRRRAEPEVAGIGSVTAAST